MMKALQEIEIKLRLFPEDVATVMQHPLLSTQPSSSKKNAKQATWQDQPLINFYYDTTELDLASAKVALRVRQDGEQYIQTLKTSGIGMAGISDRQEWDWPLTDLNLNTELLTHPAWPDTLHHLDTKSIHKLFTTHFLRKRHLLTLNNQVSECDVAVDVGEVQWEDRKCALCELELELRKGEVKDLLQLAKALAKDIPLIPSDISKAQRGYRLIKDKNIRPLKLPKIKDATLEVWILALVTTILKRAQHATESFWDTGHRSSFQIWWDMLQHLQAIFTSLQGWGKRADTHDIRENLDIIWRDWHSPAKMALMSSTDSQQSLQLHQTFIQSLRNKHWGLLSLAIACWLTEKPWVNTNDTKAEGYRKQSATRWLRGYFLAQWSEMPLEQLAKNPMLWGDQLTRMNRIHFLALCIANITLDPMFQNLQGELNKLKTSVSNEMHLTPNFSEDCQVQLNIIKKLAALTWLNHHRDIGQLITQPHE